MLREFILSVPSFVGFEGEGGDPNAGKKTYTEEEFNTHMAGLRRKYETQEAEYKKTQKELADRLEAESKKKGLSAEEKKALEDRIAALQNEFMTDKEKLERKANAEREDLTKQIEGLTGERDRWRQSFERETVNNAIARASAANKAFDADQITAVLRPMVKFEEVLNEDDEPTGQFKPVVEFPDIDTKTKAPITMKYGIDEAVKRMTELDKFQNLFEDTMRSGVGGSRNAKGGKGKIDAAQLAKENPAEYRRLRKEQPEALYSSVRGNR